MAVIGFLNTTLSSVEGDSVNFSIGVLQGSLDVSVTIMFTTEDVTAKGILIMIHCEKLIQLNISTTLLYSWTGL